MIIENRDGLTILYAEGTNKITNQKRSFFSDLIYLGKGDSVDNYVEVEKIFGKISLKLQTQI